MTYTPRNKVGYYYDPDVGNFYYAQGHPMKPHRIRMTHNLLLAYGIFDRMDLLSTPRATDRDMTRFHSDEYISFLKLVSPETLNDNLHTLCRFNVLEDCPVFDGLWEYCQIAAGGSLAGAARLNAGESDTAINWAGGLHHAKKAEASGFCYINDCVLAILELLKVHPRVLYVDIDIHHGDGVEEAFYTTDRVMTASFHKFGDYFPGTGHVHDIGIGKGKHYSANFPLRDGIDDESYRSIFEPVMTRIMDWYKPGAVVLQCGADSLSGDRLGCFNLSLTGHARCVDFFKSYDVPLLMLGGGGYTIRNVARCWAYETSRVVGETLSDELPFNDNYEFYGPEFRLHILPSNMENHNSPSELHNTTMKIFEHLRQLPHAPSTPFHDTPRRPREDEEEDDPDVRQRNRRAKMVVDYDGSDDEDDDQYISSLRRAKRKAKRMNFPRRRYPSTGSAASVDKNRPTGIFSPTDAGVNGAPIMRVTSGSATAVVRENGGVGKVVREDRATSSEQAPDGAKDASKDGKEADAGDARDSRDESGRGRALADARFREEHDGRQRDAMEVEHAENGGPVPDADAEKDATVETDEREGLERREGTEGKDDGVRDAASEKSDASGAEGGRAGQASSGFHGLECDEGRADADGDERERESDGNGAE